MFCCRHCPSTFGPCCFCCFYLRPLDSKTSKDEASTRRRFFNTKILCARKPFGRENVIAVVILKRVLAKMLWWRKHLVGMLNPVHTGDFCRATRCKFCRALSCIQLQSCSKLLRYRGNKIAGCLHARFLSYNSE